MPQPFGSPSTGMLATVTTPAFAADDQAKSAATQTQQDSAEQDLIKVSEDALMTMRNIRGARLSIFNGSPDKAQVFADAAATRVAATLADADKYALDVKKSVRTAMSTCRSTPVLRSPKPWC